MKFACFERTVELLYKHVVPKPRAECTKPEQLVVTFVAGYIAGFALVLLDYNQLIHSKVFSAQLFRIRPTQLSRN